MIHTSHDKRENTLGIEPPETATLNTPRASTDSFAIAPNRLTSSVTRASGLDPTSKVVVMAGGREKTAGLRERNAVCRSVSCREIGVGTASISPYQMRRGVIRQPRRPVQDIFSMLAFVWNVGPLQQVLCSCWVLARLYVTVITTHQLMTRDGVYKVFFFFHHRL